MDHIFISSGEVSSDHQAAWLVRGMKKKCPLLQFSGVGGAKMAQIGVELLFDDMPYFSSVGLWESVSSIPYLLLRMIKMLYFVWKKNIRMVILFDNQGFNLMFARLLKYLGQVRIIYYFPPHVSIWGRWNVKKVVRLVDAVICPFYSDYVLYQTQDSSKVFYVGHPLLEQIDAALKRSSCLVKKRHQYNQLHIGLFPGTRQHEIKHLLPIFLDVAMQVKTRYNSSFYIAIPPIYQKEVEHIIQCCLGKDNSLVLKAIGCADYVVYQKLDFAMVSSGTITLELALLDVAMAIAYQLNTWSYALLKPWIYSPYMAMPNILLNEERFPEFKQEQVSAKNLMNCFEHFINSPKNEKQLPSIELRQLLFLPKTTERVCQILMQ